MLSENQKKIAKREYERLSYSEEARKLFLKEVSPDTLTELFKDFLKVMQFEWSDE